MSTMEGTSVSDTSTSVASDVNPGGDPGSTVPGAPVGTQPVADSFAAEREQYEGRVRSFQSRADQMAAKVADLEAKLAAVGDGGAGNGPGAESQFDPDVFASRLESQFTHRMEMRTLAQELQGEFEYADSDILARAHEFEDGNALRAALEESHQAVSAFVDEVKSSTRSEVLAEIQAKYGIQIEAAPATQGDAPAGEPSAAEFASWSFSDQGAYEAQNPGFTDRLLRSINT